MKITPTQYNPQTFKGYGARPLKAVIIRNTHSFNMYETIKQVKAIGEQHNFEVYIQGSNIQNTLPSTPLEFDKTRFESFNPWIQDNLIIAGNKIIFHSKDSEKENQALIKYLGMQSETVTRASDEIQGGNTYLLEDNTLLLGERENKELASKIYGTDKIIQIPEADFHIDLFIRPLKDRNILVADDEMTLEILKQALKRLKKTDCPNKINMITKLYRCIHCMNYTKNNTPYADMEKVAQKLTENGFNVIRVPGRIYDSQEYNRNERKYLVNYINGIVHENDKGELVYITNKDNFLWEQGIPRRIARHINLNLEELFTQAVKDYIKPENIYFVKGGKKRLENLGCILEKSSGGIHCLSKEIPR